jgi:alpha-1,2-mannosyltransferase
MTTTTARRCGLDPCSAPRAASSNDIYLLGFAYLVWLILLVAVGVKALVSPEMHSVWPVFATGSGHWWKGQSLYGYYPGLDLFRYSPTFAVLLTPLALLPLRLGGCLWGALNVGLLLASLQAVQRHILPGNFGPRGRSAFLLLAAAMAVAMVWNLQGNALILALVTLGAVAIAKQRWWAAAFLLAAPVFFKVWPLAAVLLLIACWPRQLAGRFALAFAAFALVPFLTASPTAVVAAHAEWSHYLTLTSAWRWPGHRDAWTVWEAIATPVNPQAYRLLQALLALGALALCLRCRFRPVSQRQLLTVVLGSWVCWQLLVGPGTERNTYGLIAPLMSWGVVFAWKERQGRLCVGLSCLLLLLFSIGEVERGLGLWFPGAKAMIPLSVAGYAVWLIRYVHSLPRSGDSVPGALSVLACGGARAH